MKTFLNNTTLSLRFISIYFFTALLLPVATVNGQTGSEPEYIGGFRVISPQEKRIQDEQEIISKGYYNNLDTLFKAREYEKVIKGADYIISNNTQWVENYYYYYASCLQLKKYKDALAIVEKGINQVEKLGWRKKISEDDYFDKQLVKAILYAGKYKALIGLKEYAKANDTYFYNSLSVYSYYVDVREYFLPIAFDQARIQLYVGNYAAAIKMLDELINDNDSKYDKKVWKTMIDEIRVAASSAICEINYLNNTPDNIPSKAKKNAITDFSDYGHLINLYIEGKYQEYVTAFNLIDNGSFTVLYKYLGLCYYKLNQKEQSCAAFKKYYANQNPRIPKVEPEIDDVVAAVCK